MLRTRLAILTALVLILGLAAVPGTGRPSNAQENGTADEATTLAVYLLLDQGDLGPFLVPVERDVGETSTPALAAVSALLDGPTQAEAASVPAVSAGIPEGVTLNAITITAGLATVDLSAGFEAGGGSLAMLSRLAQLVYTVTQFPTVDGIALELDGEPVTVFSGEGIDVTPPVTRADIEGTGVIPPVLVETPRYGGLHQARLTGTSEVGDFSVAVYDGDGRLLGGDDVSLGEIDGREPFDVTVPYVSLTSQFGIVLVESDQAPAVGPREYPVTLAPTPVPTARSLTAACPGDIPDAGFVDVSTTHAEAIDCIAWRGITVGRTPTTFEPAGIITRGQMASMMAGVLEATGTTLPSDPASSFTDVEGTTHETAIDQLTTLGIVHGRPDGTYGPQLPVTRAQTASLLVRTYTHVAGTTPEAERDYFTDTEGNVHATAIDVAALAGLTTGVDSDRFAPDEQLRRDQMASFAARLLDLLVVEAGAVLAD